MGEIRVTASISVDIDEILRGVPESRKNYERDEILKVGFDEWLYVQILDSIYIESDMRGVSVATDSVDDMYGLPEYEIEEFIGRHPWLPGADPDLDIKRPYDVVLPFEETEIKLVER